MIMATDPLADIVAKTPWCARWVRRGMLCVSDGSKAFELKNGTIPHDAVAIGCGGWDEAGALHWVGIDLDVGHGKPEQCYETTELAVDAAAKVRDFVGGAAEIRLSKSGSGVHIRIAIASGITNGREVSRYIAKWLAKTLELKCDQTVLGRQNLWFWARSTNTNSFFEIEKCEGEWTPPPSALKPEVVKPAVVPSIPQTARTDAAKRAIAYMRKVAPAVSGSGGHDQAFKAACALVCGFGLSVDEARPIFTDWCNTCQPPWNEKEIEHKLQQAATKSRHGQGYLLNKALPEKHRATETQPAPVIGADAVLEQLEDEISGKRYAASWPWTLLHRSTLALLPGTITVICAPPSVGKSFMVLQAVDYWQSNGYDTAMLVLEENRKFQVRRALAQISENSNITDPEWVKAHADEARALYHEHKEHLDRLNACIHEPSAKFSTDSALAWIKDMLAAGKRIIVIDPITARDPSQQPWIDDWHFVRHAGDMLKNADASLVLVSHPKDSMSTTLDNLAGGKAYQRFGQTVIWLEWVEPEIKKCKTIHGVTEQWINRKLHLRKTRSGRAMNAALGFFFDGGTLKFIERGQLEKDKKGRS